MPGKNKIVQRFKMARARDGRSQMDVAAAMGRERGKLAKFESGTGDLAADLQFVAELARQYQVSADWLLGLTDELRTLDGRGDEKWAAAYGRLSPSRQRDMLSLAQFFAFIDSEAERKQMLVVAHRCNLNDSPIVELLSSLEERNEFRDLFSGEGDGGEK